MKKYVRFSRTRMRSIGIFRMIRAHLSATSLYWSFARLVAGGGNWLSNCLGLRLDDALEYIGDWSWELLMNGGGVIDEISKRCFVEGNANEVLESRVFNVVI